MLLTFTYGRVCYEEWVKHTWSGSSFSGSGHAGLVGEKIVKDTYGDWGTHHL